MTPILQAKNIKKIFTNPVQLEILSGIDFTVEPGQSVAIMGRSGEGKTTLLHILGTLEKATSGTLEIAGKNGWERSLEVRNQHIGFVFQGFHLLEEESALENVLMPARIGRRGSLMRPEAERLLQKVGLAQRSGYNVKQLSGGERQRVAIARALCNDPDIILADEPTGNLDKQTADGIHELLFSFVKEGKALVVVTHDPSLAALCDKTLYLRGGVLEEFASPASQL